MLHSDPPYTIAIPIIECIQQDHKQLRMTCTADPHPFPKASS